MNRILALLLICGVTHWGYAQNFGIGTTSPSQKLHVVGNSLLAGRLYIGSTDAYFYRDAANRISTPDDFYVQSSSDATYLYSANTYLGYTSGDNIHLRGNQLDWNNGILTTSGDLGLGTSSPSQKLDVNGNIRIRGGSPAIGQVLTATSTNGTADWQNVVGIDNLGNHNATTTLQLNDYNITEVNQVTTRGESDYDKLRVYNSSNYTIGMHSGMTMGGLNDWAMTFTFNNDGNRGFLWRDTGDDQSDGAMALTTGGRLTVKGRVDIGTSASSGADLYLADRLIDWDNTDYYMDPDGVNRVNEIQADDGSVTDPSYYFAGDDNTGFYQPADDQIGIAINGVQAGLINASGQAFFGNDIYVMDEQLTNNVVARIYDSGDDGILEVYRDNVYSIRLHANGTSVFNERSTSNCDVRMESDASTYMFWMDASANEVGIYTSNPNANFSVNGSASKPGGGSWATFSDRRVKRDIKPYKDGLAEVLQINPVKFKYIDEFAIPDDKDKEIVGILAQEIREIAPYMVESDIYDPGTYESGEKRESVFEEGTELYMYDPSALDYMLVNAIKDQQKLIEAAGKARKDLITEMDDYESVISGMELRSLKTGTGRKGQKIIEANKSVINQDD